MKNKEITLAQSVRSDNILIAKDLIKKGADVNAPDSIGWTPINLAAFYGRTEIAQALITAGVDVNTTDGRSAPLHEAAQYGHTKNSTSSHRSRGQCGCYRWRWLHPTSYCGILE